MDKKRSFNVLSTTDSVKLNINNRNQNKDSKGDGNITQSSSRTQYFKREFYTGEIRKLNEKEVKKLREGLDSSGSSETFQCVHGPEGKQYTEEEILNKYLTKKIDPITVDQTWVDPCPLKVGWEVAQTLVFMVKDPIAMKQLDRMQSYLRDFAKTAEFGYKIDVLDDLCLMLDYFVEKLSPKYVLREEIIQLLHCMEKPILLNATSDVVTYFHSLTDYINFMGYLLVRLEEDDIFDIVSNALIWHLSYPDFLRKNGQIRQSHTFVAATGLCETVVRMLSLSTNRRFPTFLEIALLFACDNVDICVTMMRSNIIENLFYRFNPYFPDRDLPIYDINPADPQDFRVVLGASSINLSTTLSLLLVLLKTTKDIMSVDPEFCSTLPCPDSYSQRCFAWAYRYECRARDHRHERITLTIISSCLLHCFGDRLTELSNSLMPDVISLSVRTEIPARPDWTGSINFNTSQLDVRFKQVLIYLSVDFFKTFPNNRFNMESRHWLLGLMYLLDPVLCKLRARWSPALYSDLRKTTFKALICTLPIASMRLVQEIGLIRRLMWYIEWYSESPYDLSVLYWCLRVLQVTISRRDSYLRRHMLNDLFDSHGIIVLIHLCHTLLDQKPLPVEKSQVILCVCLRLLTSCTEVNSGLECQVYPFIKWPNSVQTLSTRMLNLVLSSLQANLILNERWMISLLNFVWESIIWNGTYRSRFVADDGVYKLLDMISLTTRPVQCLALALLCDVARAGEAVGQIVTWRANSSASQVIPNLVRRGATIANLLAAIFRDECHAKKILLSDTGVIQDLDCPLMRSEIKEQIYCLRPEQYIRGNVICLPAADIAGSRLSKVFAILHMLSKDLAFKVSLADDTYNLYKNIKLPPQDEATLILCSHYLTLKLNETWIETKILSPLLLPQGAETLQELVEIAHGWAKEIKQMQEEIFIRSQKEDCLVECSFYEFLSRARLNIALDALREVRCMARASDRLQISHDLLHDAVMAQKLRHDLSQSLNTEIKKTYIAPLDAKNTIGQHVKVTSIKPKQIDSKDLCVCHVCSKVHCRHKQF
ncbi:PREDICTED: uncharacterized protein LOC106109021 isoform X2 [Papilio polytes]|uniref:uncharacterized protein LOC106109021 isoform X2 n=1 Tax=Papilio polytes TaxID=76194 RepID=UPI000676A8AC|nr:PREDICTED: uncharacterized protein LOC106109021 isoform X2 [Papilio polytes]